MNDVFFLLITVLGLGTSSILAGAVIAAICTATGKKVDSRSLIHLVIDFYIYLSLEIIFIPP